MSEEAIINDVLLNYVVQGSGAPLYLLHGGMESRDSFTHQIPALTKHFTVVALDSREQGRSGPSDQPISYEVMAQDVLELTAHLGHDKISILGSSDGANTAIALALSHPEKVDHLILCGANFNVDAYPPEVLKFLKEYKWDGDTDPNRYPGMMIDHYLSGHDNLDGFGELLQKMTLMWTTSPNHTIEDLKAIKAKTLVINGDRDDTVLEHALALYRGLDDAQLFVVPGGSHYALQTHPEVINRAVLDFLAQD